MNHTAKQYACSTGATFRDQGTHVIAFPYVTRSWGTRVASGSYPQPALICAQPNSTPSFHGACHFDQAGIVYSGLLTPRVNDAFNSSFKKLSGRFPCRGGRVYNVHVSEKLMN